MCRTVIITRHGNRQDFVDPDWRKTAVWPDDPPLSEDGIVQARELGDRLRCEQIQHIFSSPFLRTIETASQVAEVLDLSVKVEHGLSEWLNAEWFGAYPALAPFADKIRMFPRIDRDYRSRLTPTYPETWEDVVRRGEKLTKGLTEDFSGNLLLVGHGASVDVTAWGLIGEKCEINSTLCCLVKIVRSDHRWAMEINGES